MFFHKFTDMTVLATQWSYLLYNNKFHFFQSFLTKNLLLKHHAKAVGVREFMVPEICIRKFYFFITQFILI